MLARAFSACWAFVVACGMVSGCGATSARPPAERHAFDARLSLRGECVGSRSDSVVDPGCPYRRGHEPRALSKPCGVATDRLGYVYIASSGPEGEHEGRIDVFDPGGSFVTEIELPPRISERPCRIDLDRSGRIFIAARPWAQPSQPDIDVEAHPHAKNFRYGILRYAPDSWPPMAGIRYGEPTLFALAGESYGVAIDPSNGHVFVASGPVVEYAPNGDLLNTANQVQEVAMFAEEGSFALALAGYTTKQIPYGATAARTQAALEDLPSVGSRNVTVMVDDGLRSFNGLVRYKISFVGELGDTSEVQQVECRGSRLIGKVKTCTATMIRRGSSGAIGLSSRDVDVWGRNHDIYTSAESPAGGEWVVRIYDGETHRSIETIRGASADPSGPYPSIAVDQVNGDLYVEDFKSHRIKRYVRNEGSGKFELVASIRHGSFLNRVEGAGSDLVVDSSPQSPNCGYVFATAETGTTDHLYAFAPRPSQFHMGTPCHQERNSRR